jgi:N-acyl-D-aspartate/D-glutamate deacylase
MIASDGRLTNGRGHLRGAGTYARVLGKYVREEKVLSLMDAIRKSSLMPAQRLESMSPQMRQKGRFKIGADADISVFDPARVIDKATYEKPGAILRGLSLRYGRRHLRCA